jgi:putative phosphoribosyl transferase
MSAGDILFRDRRHAGRVLAGLLDRYRGDPRLVVLALPRGGVPVAFEVAQALEAPLDVCVVRKLGFPGHEEYAMGAIASGGIQVLNPAAAGKVSRALIARVVAREQLELQRRERLYRGEQPPLQLRDQTVIVVDDGLATGSTMRAAVRAIRQQQPAHICVAVPVGARETCEQLRHDADDLVCAEMPEDFRAVGLAYQDFEQAGDEEVRTLLEAARLQAAAAAH